MRWLFLASMILSGCHAYTLDIEGRIEERATRPIDAAPHAPKQESLPKARLGVPQNDREINQISHQEKLPSPGKKDEQDQPKKYPSMVEQLHFREGVLGFKIEDIDLGPISGKDFKAKLQKYFPPLPEMPRLPEGQLTPEGRALTLTDLQQLALRTSPLIRQAHQDIEAARGLALQAGLYPNPTIGYEADTINSGRTHGQQGGYVNQTIKTAGKLTLARAAAQADVQIAEQKLRQAESDVQTQVRQGYFAVLSARTNYEVTKALAELTDKVYNVLLLQMQAGEVAAYEPMQIRVLAVQARGQLVQAHNKYISSWKQLAAAMGMPQMPLTILAGKIDMPVPQLDYERVLEFVLRNHSDVVSASLGVDKGRFLVRLEEVRPFPDVNVNLVLQKDYTTPPFATTANVNVGVPFPLWDRNQGNIQAVRAQLQRAIQENLAVRNNLSSKVAEAFGRYETNRVMIRLYREQMLPNQVQAFRAAVARHAAVGDKSVSYNDLVNSQQTLASLIASYLGTLSDQWTAVVDIAGLLQTNDLFQLQPMEEVAPIPDVIELHRGRLRHSH